MVYEVGGIRYKDKKAYQKALKITFGIFLACIALLFYLRGSMLGSVFNFTMIIAGSMLIHIILKYLHSEEKMKYLFYNL